MQAADLLADMHDARLTWLHGNALSAEAGHFVSVGIKHPGHQRKRVRLVVVILHLRFGMYRSPAVGDVEIGGIDIGAGSTQIRIERECLVEKTGDV